MPVCRAFVIAPTACGVDLGVEQQAMDVRPSFAERMSDPTAEDFCMRLGSIFQQCVGPIGRDGLAPLYLLVEGRVVALGRFAAVFDENGYSMREAPHLWVRDDEAVWPGPPGQETIYLYRDGAVREIHHHEGEVMFVALSSGGEIWGNTRDKEFAVIGLDGVTLRYEGGPPFAYHDSDKGAWAPLTR